MTCPTCNGTKHVSTDGRNWTRCKQCYTASATEAVLAALPPQLRDVSLDNLTKRSKDAVEFLSTVVSRLAAGAFPKRFVLVSGNVTTDQLLKDELVAAFIHDAALVGVAAERVSLAHCTDSYFQNKPEWVRLLKCPPDTLIVQMGSETPNGGLIQALQEIVRERKWRGGYTIITSHYTIEEMRRVERYPKGLIEFLTGDSFKEVLVTPKPRPAAQQP